MLNWNDVLNFARNGNPAPDRKVLKTDDEWRRVLSPEAFAVMRQTATERAFSSEMCSLFKPGIYQCAGCDTVLFDAEGKFESGTGWPSFTQPQAANVVAYRVDEQPRNDEGRGPVQCLRCAPGPRVSGWTAAKRAALLHERRCAEKPRRRRSSSPGYGRGLNAISTLPPCPP